jgi:putative aldouronate transport system substrate-binding protein
MRNRVSRRELLRVAGMAAATTALAACQPQVVEKVVEKPVVVEKPIEKTAKETVVVKQEVTKVVEKEKVVTATPSPCKPDFTVGLPPVPKKYSPTVKVSFPFTSTPNTPFLEGMNFTNNPLYNWTKENMGLEFTIHWQADGDLRNTKLQADIAAGTLPDMFNVQDPLLSKLIDNGALAEIRSIWEATASPLVKQETRYPNGKNWISGFRGDKLYGCAMGLTDDALTGIGFIRRDLLDKVGMDMPNTLEGFEKVMRAFVDAKLTTYGPCACNTLISYMNTLDQVFGAYGAMPTNWRDRGDGKLAYESIAPEIKSALGKLRDWYKGGLLHPEFYAQDQWGAARNSLAEGKTAWGTCPMWGMPWFVNNEKANPGRRWETTKVFTGPDGKRGRKGTSPLFHAWVFRKGLSPTAIEACINQLNFYMELHTNGAEKHNAYGSTYSPWCDGLFLEGQDWVWTEDCKIALGKGNTGGWFRDIGFWKATYPGYQRAMDAPKLKWAAQDPSKLNKAQQFFVQDPNTLREANAYKYVLDTPEQSMVDEFLGLPTPRMAELLPNLRKLEDETFVQIISGKKDLNAFDSFVQEWKKVGGDEVTRDVNAWYATSKK